MINALIFDCFGVLYTGSRSYVMERATPAQRPELRDIFKSADHGMIDGDEGIRRIATILAMEPRELQTILDHQLIRHDAMVALVKRLRAQGYKTGLLSNVDNVLMGTLFDSAEQAALFDAVVLSSVVGKVKPSADIYEHILDELQVAPQEALMIDDLERNVTGAREIGMPGIVYQSYDQFVAALQEYGIDARAA